MWTIHARFRLGAYEFREVDITPLIGVMLSLSALLLVARFP